MIKVADLYKELDGQVVLNELNLHVHEGEIVVILGQSGAGKSVFLRHLIGLMKPDRGSIEIDSVDITGLSEKELLKVRRNVGYLFQEGALFDFMTVYENLAFPLEEHTNFKKGQIAQKVRELLEVVGLKGVEQKYPVELSGGMRKRAALARSVILNTKLLFCDEPTSGLDPMRSRNISDLIKRISRQLKCTTVITSHDISNAFHIADRLVIIHEGRFLTIGTQRELASSKDPVVREFLNE